jgi:hypothetical protein
MCPSAGSFKRKDGLYSFLKQKRKQNANQEKEKLLKQRFRCKKQIAPFVKDEKTLFEQRRKRLDAMPLASFPNG